MRQLRRTPALKRSDGPFGSWWVVVPMIGSGAEGDPYRPDVDGSEWAAWDQGDGTMLVRALSKRIFRRSVRPARGVVGDRLPRARMAREG